MRQTGPVSISTRVIAVALVALAGTVLGGGPAAASQGSVPAVVSAYAADPTGLLARLDDLAGVGANGKGIQFDDTTAVGQVNRVFTFTAEWLTGKHTDVPVERQNLWTAPVTIADKPIGLAIIWINPASDEPELADFLQDVELTSALADVPADAYLVRDEPRGAWFTLLPPTLTPVYPGDSGVDDPTSLGRYQGLIGASPAPVVSADPNLGSVLSVVTISVVALLIVGAVLLPVIRRRDKAKLRIPGP